MSYKKGEYEMALISCPECGKMISNKSKQCINCGYPLEDEPIDKTICTINDEEYDLSEARILYENQEPIQAIEKLLEIYPYGDRKFANNFIVMYLNYYYHNHNSFPKRIDSRNLDISFSELQNKSGVLYFQYMRENRKKKKEDYINSPTTCPKCGSINITTGARGVSPVLGLFGASSTVNRCSKCGHVWKPKLK